MLDKIKEKTDQVIDNKNIDKLKNIDAQKAKDAIGEKIDSFDAKESMENSKEFLKNQTENLKNVDMDEVKKKWNWKGFFFNAYYFAGYGALQKGIMLAFLAGLSMLSPFLIILPLGIAIYGGLKVNEELDFNNEFNWKNVAIAIGANIVAIIIATMLSSLFGSSNISLVKNGIMEFDKSTTLGQALDNWDDCSDTRWESFTTKNGKEVVQFTCEVTGANKLYNVIANDDFIKKYYDSKDKSKFDKFSQNWNIKKQITTFQFVIDSKGDKFNFKHADNKIIWDDGKTFTKNSQLDLSQVYNNELTYKFDAWNNLSEPARVQLILALAQVFVELKAQAK